MASPESPPSPAEPEPEPESAPSTTSTECADLKETINEQMELQQQLNKLLEMNTEEMKRILSGTTNKFDQFTKFMFELMESEEEKVQRLIKHIGDEVGKQVAIDRKTDPVAVAEDGGKNESVKLQRSSSKISSLVKFFTGTPNEGSVSSIEVEESDVEVETDENHKDHSASSSTKLIPAFTMLALLVKELKEVNGTFKQVATVLDQLHDMQGVILEQNRNAQSIAKCQWIVGKERLEIEQEKLQVEKDKLALLRQIVKGSTKGGRGDGGGGFGPCFSL